MMKILYLYYDLMNLYGENGNIRVLKRHLEDQGQEVTVDRKTVGDDIDFSQYGFIYAGSGTERNQKKAMEHLVRYKDEFIKAVEGNAVALFTGNSFEMLGTKVTDCDGRVFEGLGLLDFETKESDDVRYTGDAICNMVSDETQKPLVGFINKCSTVTGISDPLFEMTMGYGNTNSDNGEGMRVNNLFGTHLTGPILAKNPHFTAMILGLIGEKEGFAVTAKTYEYEEKAYEVTLRELQKRAEG